MARLPTTPVRTARFVLFPATLRLARWRLRHTWRLLMTTGLGMVVAVLIVCAVPLFSWVTTTAGLRATFATAPTRTTIAVKVITDDVQTEQIQQLGTLIDAAMQTHLGYELQPGNQFTTQLPIFPVRSAVSRNIGAASLQVIGYDVKQFAPHTTLLAGRLPHAGATPIEIALTQTTATALGANVGSTVLLDTTNTTTLDPAAALLSFTVIGIVTVNAEDNFFHHLYFEPQRLQPTAPEIFSRVIAANNDLLQLVQSPLIVGPLRAQTQFNWYYSLAPARLDAGKIDNLITRANAVQIELPNNLLRVGGSPRGSVSGDAFTTLTDYQLRMNTVQVPITFVLLLVVTLVLFFVSTMAEIVVDRQADAIAILRSRGVSRPQILGALLTQSLGLGIVALVIGPLLALVAVIFTAQRTLTPADQGALDLLTDHPLRVAYTLPWTASFVVVAAVGALLIASNRATAANVLAMRRESARTTYIPFWQRFYLDIVAAIVAVTGYLIDTLVLSRVGAALQFQLGFLGLVAPTFLVLAGTLLFFRIYPLIIRGAAWVAGRGKGAVPMLAITQMARSPRHSLRTTFLLAFATAFMLFTIIFTASETQHLRDVASFSAGADFSGALPYSSDPLTNINDRMLPYSQIPGVTSVALGYTAPLPSSAGITHQQLVVVDADHYAQTATWDAHNSTQSLSSLMAQLVSYRGEAAHKGVIPAILSASLWDAQQLTPGTQFSLSVPGYDENNMRFVALDRVEHIQGIYDSSQFFSGGVLVDYQSYAAVFTTVTKTPPAPPNIIWLRSVNDSATVASIRQSLTTGKLRLASLVDRRALTQLLITDALQVNLSGVLTIGATAAIVLALVGVLTASWLNARSRVTNFALLRAIGTTPRQIAGVLIWEQGITYSVALGVGVLLGIGLAYMLLPVLAFANARTDGGDLIGAANLPAIQLLAPAGTVTLALGSLVVICVGAIVFMTVVVARPSVSATLRLNED